MKVNFRKLKLNQILLGISIVVILVWLFRIAKEKYEEMEQAKQTGPSVEKAAESKQMTQAELDAVLKFINQ
jgi:Tfp pilus assembly protein PilO